MDVSESLRLESARLAREQFCAGAALVPLLQLGVAHLGELSPEWMAYVARLLGLPRGRVESVASAFPGWQQLGKGRHILALCRSLSCLLGGRDTVVRHLHARLHIGPGETTPDGRITLVEVDCLGACSTAPAMLVDGELHDSLTVTRIDEILGGLS